MSFDRQRRPDVTSARSRPDQALENLYKYARTYDPLRISPPEHHLQGWTCFVSKFINEGAHPQPSPVTDSTADLSQVPSAPKMAARISNVGLDQYHVPYELEEGGLSDLKSLMYQLQELEAQRQEEVRATLTELGIDHRVIRRRDMLATHLSRERKWLQHVEHAEQKMQARYSAIHLVLRHWMLVAVLLSAPFDAKYCLAMLDALFPLIDGEDADFVPLTTQLTLPVLTHHRTQFSKLITAPERLQLMSHARRKRDEHGWVTFHGTLGTYVNCAAIVIEQCRELAARGRDPTVGPCHRLDSGHTSNCNSAPRHEFVHGYRKLQNRTIRSSAKSNVSDGSFRREFHVSRDTGHSKKLSAAPKSSGPIREGTARDLRQIRNRLKLKDHRFWKGLGMNTNATVDNPGRSNQWAVVGVLRPPHKLSWGWRSGWQATIRPQGQDLNRSSEADDCVS